MMRDLVLIRWAPYGSCNSWCSNVPRSNKVTKPLFDKDIPVKMKLTLAPYTISASQGSPVEAKN